MDWRDRASGDDFATAVPIAALPFAHSANTCGFSNDYDESCEGFNGPGPDFVYSITPSSDRAVDISVCNAGYDNRLVVYENTVASFVGCSEDTCGADGFRAAIPCQPLTAGNKYYIVVDGFQAGACGDFTITVNDCECAVSCPPGALAEGEIDCGTDYVDETNGGCNSSPPVFGSLGSECVTTVCGTYGGYDVLSSTAERDTDWYEIDLSTTTDVVWTVEGELETLAGIVDGTSGCPDSTFLAFDAALACDPARVAQTLGPGTYWLYVAPNGFGPEVGACGSSYTATLERCPPGSATDAAAHSAAGSPELRLTPNPFRDDLSIAFEAPRAAFARLDVFDVRGRRVVTLLEGELLAGAQEVRWDGRSQNGRRVTTGAYFVRLVSEEFSVTKKILFID